MTYRAKVRTCLCLESRGLEAAEYYVALLPWSAIDAVLAQGNPDDPMIVEFTLHDAPMMIMSGGPPYKLSPAASISVLTKDQDETDRLWSALVSDGGATGRCGWLTDRWGVSWQIVPEALPRFLSASDRVAAGRAMSAMMAMTKIDIGALDAAFHEAEGE